MKDEIKEILNKWKCYIELTKKFTTNEYEMLRVEDIDKILDYITNLQEENNHLKQNKKRTLEYIENNKQLSMFADLRKEGTHQYTLECDADDLLEILQGKSDE